MAQPGPQEYIPRLIEPRLEALFQELPALMLVGPRAVGKTTTALRYANDVVRLDREADAVAFRADPDVALRGLEEPVLLDEWQAVPGVLGAVKRAVDADPRPARFLITGSVRADLQGATWPGTGRLVRLRLLGLTVGEQARGSEGYTPLFERMLRNGPEVVLEPVADPPDLRGYLELALRSGFPEPALRLGAAARDAWLNGYLEQLLTRDAELVDAGRDPDRLRRYLTAYATVTAQVVDEKTLWEAAGINRKTAIAYEQLLKNLFVVDWLPAWSSRRLTQLVRRPKRHVVDPALAASILGLDVEGVMREGALLGGFIESFVVSQIRAEARGLSQRAQLAHLRTRGGRHEVDLVVELGARKVIGVEVKVGAAPGSADGRHLRWLQERVGDRFVAGLVLHTGPRSWRLDTNIFAAPIATLWR